MLQLQRASAGSGKTYTLAKKYLTLLLSEQAPQLPRTGGAGADSFRPARRRLRRDREIGEEFKHILAVTFTNEATLEMKRRIISSLAALAYSAAPEERVEYLRDFREEFDASREDIQRTARTVLHRLLNSYSDFHVSTIDSFFQTVLRTFAYEVELNDSYDLELDSQYIVRVGIDAMLEEITADKGDAETTHWLRERMAATKGSGNQWNLFRKSTGQGSAYSELVGLSRLTAKEDYKRYKFELDAYFREHPDYLATYEAADREFTAPVRLALRRAKERAALVLEHLEREHIDPADLRQYVAGHLQKIAEGDIEEMARGPKSAPGFGFAATKNSIDQGKSCYAGKVKNKPPEEPLRGLLADFYEAVTEVAEAAGSKNASNWKALRKGFATMGLIKVLRERIHAFLTENNLLELGDTNTLLSRIIGEDETPFIYERLGTWLTNFLIDEFQDTSALQWENFKPLLTESESNFGEGGADHDNLIIGDAKQSIYGFRNADPSIITRRVPATFPRHYSGEDPVKENTNHRSSETIVRFNNTFFRTLARLLDEDFHKEGEPEYSRLYSNAVQPIEKLDGKGEVHIRYTQPATDEEGKAHYDSYSRLGDLIASLHRPEEGSGRPAYALRDICILVNAHADGASVIEALLAYNNERVRAGAPEEQISFVSEESLKLGSSAAVAQIVGVLELITKGRHLGTTDADEAMEERAQGEYRKIGRVEVGDIGCDFTYFRSQNRDLTLTEALRRFLTEKPEFDALSRLMADLRSVALPSLVEAVIRDLVAPELRTTEAPFLAAFQDTVIDYCNRYSPDPASFLDWWEQHKETLSISASKETEAVSVMTIHKAKGLEFPVVILPMLDLNFSPRGHELWVRPDFDTELALPPIVPLAEPNKEMLAGTSYEKEYRQLDDNGRQETLNKLYVAFTRAKRELYMFVPRGGTQTRIGSYIERMMPMLRSCSPDASVEDPRELEWMLSGEEFAAVPETEGEEISGLTISYTGKPRDYWPRPGKEPDPNEHHATMDEYAAPHNRMSLKLVEDTGDPSLRSIELPDDEPATDDEPEEEDPDPRSEGNLLHAIMERIVEPGDVGRAVDSQRVKGVIDTETAEKIKKMISSAIAAVEERGWFDRRNRILNERTLLCTRIRSKNRRPDRIVLTPEGHAVVIDYKFGDSGEAGRYAGQVRRYMDYLLRAGVARSAEGWIWYPREGVLTAVAPDGGIQ